MAGIGKRVPIKIVEQSPVMTGGNWVNNETTILRAWADMKLTSSFRVNNDQAQFGEMIEFRFRYRSEISIDTNTRLIYDGKRYTLHSITKEKGKRFYWIAKCQAKTFK